MKERTKLIEKEMQTYIEYSWYDIVDCIEMSYLLKGKSETEKIENIIKNYANDGINTWGIFIKYLYDKYRISRYEDISVFLKNEIEYYTEQFIHKFYTRDRQEIIELIESGALDDLEEFKKMNKEQQEHIIDYWVENYDKE